MKEYPKIQTVFKRDPATNMRTLLTGDYSLPEFEYLADCTWVFTEKVDGTNIRVYWDGKSVTFGGKTDNAQIPVFLLYKLQELFEGTKAKLKLKEVFGDSPALMYGEGYGNKIQSAGKFYNPDGVDFVLFDVLIGNFWLERKNVDDVAEKLGIDKVPIIGEGSLSNMVAITEKGFKSEWGDFDAEGIVARPKTELFTRKNERIITKIKHKDFK